MVKVVQQDVGVMLGEDIEKFRSDILKLDVVLAPNQLKNLREVLINVGLDLASLGILY